jgi:hypothetical protein
MEFKDKEVQATYDDLQAEAEDLENQLMGINEQIKVIEATEERA